MQKWNDHEKYLAHLKSDYWRVQVHAAIKARCLQRYGRICCERCKTEDVQLQKHHLRYDNLYRELEHLGDILWCCDECHQFLHGRIALDPADTPSWSELEKMFKAL